MVPPLSRTIITGSPKRSVVKVVARVRDLFGAAHTEPTPPEDALLFEFVERGIGVATGGKPGGAFGLFPDSGDFFARHEFDHGNPLLVNPLGLGPSGQCVGEVRQESENEPIAFPGQWGGSDNKWSFSANPDNLKP